MWEDVPWASPTPHWPYEKFHKLVVESGKIVMDATIVALDGERIAAFTTTGKSGTDRGYTWMTGTGRDYRGRGLATALKVRMLAGAKAAGLRAMLTTNDEPNKAMRGINAKLGYVMLPANVELEKTL
jgi:predicted GNAT family acetyltransferase